MNNPEYQRIKHFPARAGLSVTFVLGSHLYLLIHSQSSRYNVMLSGVEAQNALFPKQCKPD